MIYLDFEYNNSQEPFLNLVCVATLINGKLGNIWLESDTSAKQVFKNFLLKNKDKTLVAFNAVAEAQSLIALGLDPLDFKWIDLQLEFKMLQNCSYKFLYGRHLKKGKVVETTPRPSWMKDLEIEIDGWESGKEFSDKLKEMQEGKHSEADYNLGAVAFRMCNKIIDTDHKTTMRDLIIAGGPFSDKEKSDIIKYCESDVEILPAIHKAIEGCQKIPLVTQEQRLWRGRVAAMTAKMIATGYPINKEKVKNFQTNLPVAMFDLCESINNSTNKKLFKFDTKKQRHVKDTSILQSEIESRFLDSWPKTSTGKFSTSSETFDKMIPTKYSYKENDLLEQFIRYTNFFTSTNSLSGTGKDPRKQFLNYCGSDKRIRAWLNPYGAQSSRFQPKATSFLFLKGAWLRSLCEPKQGKVIIGMDFSQQEFLLGGCVSEDDKIFETYLSGDIYADFGIKSGIIKSLKGTNEYKIQRSAAKAAVLGIGYGMQSESLAKRISLAGLETSKEEAKKIIDEYYSLYAKYKKYKEKILIHYQEKGFLQLPDGWVMYGDNPSKLSVLNVPVQGLGACILRKAIENCYACSLSPIIPLHDALYIEAPLKTWVQDAKKLKDAMIQASGFYFQGEQKNWAESVRIDAEAWGPDLESGTIEGIKTEKLHIDERAEEDFKLFSKYFLPMPEEQLNIYNEKVNKLSYVNGMRQLNLWN
jgi:DNA polymerase I